MCDTMEECWDHDAEARLSASCVMERAMQLSKFQMNTISWRIENDKNMTQMKEISMWGKLNVFSQNLLNQTIGLINFVHLCVWNFFQRTNTEFLLYLHYYSNKYLALASQCCVSLETTPAYLYNEIILLQWYVYKIIYKHTSHSKSGCQVWVSVYNRILNSWIFLRKQKSFIFQNNLLNTDQFCNIKSTIISRKFKLLNFLFFDFLLFFEKIFINDNCSGNEFRYIQNLLNRWNKKNCIKQ